jgi:hypothetical protein
VSALSRGWVNITSISTRDLPTVNPNQLSHPTDREIAVQAFKRARSFFETEAMNPVVVRETAPGLNVTSDEAILDYTSSNSFQNWHASCTCRMGRADDPMTVVDSKAKSSACMACESLMHRALRCCRLDILRVSFVSFDSFYCFAQPSCRFVVMLTVACRFDGREDCGRHTGYCLVPRNTNKFQVRPSFSRERCYAGVIGQS